MSLVPKKSISDLEKLNANSALDDGAVKKVKASEELNDHPAYSGEREIWEFVEDHDDNGLFLCKICMGVFMDPHLITCCGECVCKRCIESHLLRVSTLADGEKSCPFCRNDDFKLIENSDLKKSINKLKVFCLYRKSG